MKRVLVIRQHDMMGDFLLATPALRAVRHKFPDVHLGVLVRNDFTDLLVNNPSVDEILVLHKTDNQWDPRGLGSLFIRLFLKWDLTIVLNTVSHSLSSDILAGLSGSRIILGTSDRRFEGCSRNFFYNLEAPLHPGTRHQSERNVDIVRYIGADTTDLSELTYLSEFECRAARSELQKLGVRGGGAPVIAMHIGAGKLKNRWPPDRFALLARQLRTQLGAAIVLCWGPHEQDLAEEFRRHIDFDIVRIPPRGIRELAAVFKQCDLLVCNDTGVMHLCASVGVPLVAVFGPTDPVEWKPVGKPFVAIRGADGTVESVTVEEVCRASCALVPKVRTM